MCYPENTNHFNHCNTRSVLFFKKDKHKTEYVDIPGTIIPVLHGASVSVSGTGRFGEDLEICDN